MRTRYLSIPFVLLCVMAGSVLATSARAAAPPGEVVVTFPATGDTVSVAYNPYWWRDGDYAEGVRTPALAQVDGVVLNLVFGSNTLTCDTLDLDLYLNGSVVHSFSVASGEMAITETVALATPTTTSTVTVRLQEDGTVATACGSVVIPLDQSSITFIYAQGSTYFPEAGDTMDVAYALMWWNDGDAAEGVRDPGLSQVDTLVYSYQFVNDLNAPGGICGPGGEAAFQFSINGEPVGDFTLDYSDPDTGQVTLVFDPISAVTYTVRMEMVGAVASGCGNVETPLHQSTLQLLDSRITGVFPATGDTVDVTYDPWWWRSGDNVEGERLSALSTVNAISYTLYYTNDLKAIGGACTAGGEMPLALSVDDEIVATTTITPGTPETVAIIAPFGPLSGLTHTLRLEETAQVASGCGNVEVPLDVSPFQFNDTWHSRYFPTVGDTIPADWDHVGNAATGQREPVPTEVNAAVYTLRLGSNTLMLGSAVTLSLEVNGAQAGVIPVRTGDALVNRTFNFTPVSGPIYTVTLETAGKSGLGTITIPYDRSTLRLLNTLDSAFFPATGDMVDAPSDNWNGPPDAATGVRRPSGLTQVSALTYDLRAITNTLTGTLNLRFEINGTAVGALSVPTGTLRAETVLNFAPLTSASGIYTVTMRATTSAGGRVNIPLDRSRLTLGDPQNAATFPATGDTVDEGSSQGWNQVDDRAQGMRIPGIGTVNHLEYTLYTFPNTLSCTLTTTLKLNGAIIAAIPIVGGTDVYAISENFAPISAGVGGRYTVTLTAVTNTLGCGHTHVPLDVSPLSLSYVAAPAAGFTGSPLSGYPPLGITFVATSTGIPGPSYAWDFGDTFTGMGKIVPHTYTLAGVYPVTLTVSGLGGPVTVTRLAYVTVNALISPTVAFTGVPTSGSAPLMVVFTSTTSGPVNTRLWNFGDGYTSTAIAPSHVYTTGVYTVSLTVSGPGGSVPMVRQSYITVTAPSAPQANFSATPLIGVSPLVVTFTSAVTGSVTAYAWRFGDGGTSAAANPVHVYASAGTYTVVFTATNAIGSTPVSKLNYITVSPPPAPSVSFSASPISGDVPLNVTFTGVVTGTALTYTWDFGDGGGSTAHNPMHGYTQPGVYTVVFTATGPGGSGVATRAQYIAAYGKVYLPLVLRNY